MAAAIPVSAPPRRGDVADVSACLVELAKEALAAKKTLWQRRDNWCSHRDRWDDARIPKLYGTRAVEVMCSCAEISALIELKASPSDLGRAVSRLEHCERKALVSFERLKRALGPPTERSHDVGSDLIQTRST